MLDYWQTIHKIKTGENPPIFTIQIYLIFLLYRDLQLYSIHGLSLNIFFGFF